LLRENQREAKLAMFCPCLPYLAIAIGNQKETRWVGYFLVYLALLEKKKGLYPCLPYHTSNKIKKLFLQHSANVQKNTKGHPKTSHPCGQPTRKFL